MTALREETPHPPGAMLTAGQLESRAAALTAVLPDCTLCPRSCRVDRMAGALGYCKTGAQLFISSWGPHFGEERPLVGTGGSGTIFFGNCNLGCIYCQNYSISHLGEGAEVTNERLADVMLSLEAAGCHNINLVTPTHQAPMIVSAFADATKRGLRLPLVYNCGGYESVETLRMLEGIVAIYLPDFKYADAAVAAALSDAPDYPQVAMAAITEMHRQVGDLILDDRGIAVRGLLVRHLVLPGGLAGTEQIVRFISREVSLNTYINIMDQYHPCYRAQERPPLDRRITRGEYQDALAAAFDAGLRRIDGVTA